MSIEPEARTARQRWLSRLVWAGAGASAVGAYALLRELGGGGVLISGAAVALALGTPLAAGRCATGGPGAGAQQRALRRRLGRWTLFAGGALALATGLSAAGAAGAVVLVLLGIHGGALTVRASVGGTLLALLSPALIANLALLAGRSSPTIAAYAVGLLVAVAGGVLLDSERMAGLAGRKLRGRGGDPAKRSERDVASGAGFAFALAVATLAAAPFAAAGVRGLLRPLLLESERSPTEVAEGDSDSSAEANGEARVLEQKSQAVEQSFPDGIDFGQDSAGTGEQVLIEVSALGGVPERPLYLLGLRLERFTKQGILPRAGLETTRRWAAPGRAVDGAEAQVGAGSAPWRVEWGPEASASGPVFEVRQLALADHQARGSLVFHDPRSSWFEFDDVPRGGLERDGAGALVAVGVQPIVDLLEFRFRRDGSGGEVLDVDRAFGLDLPYSSGSLGRIDELAAELERWAGGASATAEQRVQAVAQHFAQGYAYRFEGAGLLGVEALERFLEEREGFCTQFASTACLLLRRLGVPARVAIGYLVIEVDEPGGQRIARERDAHAWVEVATDARGWRVLDVTPGAAIEAARSSLDKSLEELVAENRLDAARAAWRADPIGELPGLVGAWMRLMIVRSGLGRGQLALLAGGALAGLLVLRWWLARRPARGRDKHGSGAAGPGARKSDPSELRARLVAALVASDPGAPPGVTARELLDRRMARPTGAPEGLSALELRAAVQLADRHRFAPDPLDADERATVEQACSTLLT